MVADLKLDLESRGRVIRRQPPVGHPKLLHAASTDPQHPPRSTVGGEEVPDVAPDLVPAADPRDPARAAQRHSRAHPAEGVVPVGGAQRGPRLALGTVIEATEPGQSAPLTDTVTDCAMSCSECPTWIPYHPAATCHPFAPQ